MNYQQLIIKTNKESVNFIEEVVLGLGALSVDFSDSFDNPILEPTLGTTPLWDNITLKILFNESIDKEFINNSLLEICNTKGRFEFIADKNWQKECNKNFNITKFGKNLWICPSWENCENLDGVVIKMDPGMAFGTGNHQTTSLCLEYLSNNPPIDKTVLDFGTGTGILAIGAKKLGAKKVFAIDNDPQAIIATNDNSKNNNTKIEINLAKNSSSITGIELIIANILTPVLVEFAKQFSKNLKPYGQIILSGILESQEEQVYQAYMPYFSNLTTYKKDEWLLISGDKK